MPVLGTHIPATTMVTCEYHNRALFLELSSYPLYPRSSDLGVSSIVTLRLKKKLGHLDGGLR